MFIRDDIKHLFSGLSASKLRRSKKNLKLSHGRDHEYYRLLKITSYLFAKKIEPEDAG